MHSYTFIDRNDDHEIGTYNAMTMNEARDMMAASQGSVDWPAYVESHPDVNIDGVDNGPV